MLHRTLCLLACSGALAAQTPPCISLNDATTTSSTAITAFSFAGPGVFAFQFTPSASIVLQAAEVFTSSQFASTSGYHTLEIWDENPATNLPATRLAGGTWQAQASLPVGWQGASFDQVAILNATQNYWLVWREPGGSRLPYEPGGTTAPYARFTGGNWVLQTTAQPIKWRGYCNLLDDANVQAVGLGCVSSINRIPSSFTNQPPALNNGNFQFEASGFAPGSLGIAILGVDPTWVSLPIVVAPSGCFLHNEGLLLAVVPVGTGNQQAQYATGASGHCWFDLPLPASPSYIGSQLNAQFAGFDAGSTDPLPFVFTNGVRVTMF